MMTSDEEQVRDTQGKRAGNKAITEEKNGVRK